MRVSRLFAISLTIALLVTLTIVSVGTARAEPRTPNVKTRTAETIVATWKCQDRMGWTRMSAFSPWKPHSRKFRVAQLQLWQERRRACNEAMAARVIPDTNDWTTAVRVVQRIYPGTSGWLLYISRREGGYGGFVMNHQGSGAGGWLQYMSSTYYAYSDAAFADARRRGFILNGNWNDWHHPLGQAITGAYMRYTGRDGHHWDL